MMDLLVCPFYLPISVNHEMISDSCLYMCCFNYTIELDVNVFKEITKSGIFDIKKGDFQ